MAQRRKKRSVPREVRAVLRRIEEWRRTREKLGPMPEELWEAAVEVARAHGVYAVALTLHVNYQTLKDRVEATADAAAEPAPRRRAEAEGFVELDAAALSAPSLSSVTVVELGGADGATMTMRFEGGERLDVRGLIESFWRRG